MELSGHQQYRWVSEVIKDASEVYFDQLSQWEQEFVLSLKERIEQFGDRVRLSKNQLQVIERIEKKIYR